MGFVVFLWLADPGVAPVRRGGPCAGLVAAGTVIQPCDGRLEASRRLVNRGCRATARNAACRGAPCGARVEGWGWDTRFRLPAGAGCSGGEGHSADLLCGRAQGPPLRGEASPTTLHLHSTTHRHPQSRSATLRHASPSPADPPSRLHQPAPLPQPQPARPPIALRIAAATAGTHPAPAPFPFPARRAKGWGRGSGAPGW